MGRRGTSDRHHPSYPTSGEFLAEPESLERHLPAEWKPLVAAGSLAVVFLVSGLSALPAGCSSDGPGGAASATRNAPAAGLSIVAPLFEHGDGRAATGCVVISPPVFLTEEEARQIITEELTKAGLQLTKKDVAFDGALVRSRSFSHVEQNGEYKTVPVFGEAKKLVVDLADPEKHVAVEFISEQNCDVWAGDSGGSTVRSYDFKDASQELVRQLKETRTGTRFGVFYDPAGHAKVTESSGWKKAREAGLKENREHLRKQVRDFAAWLREQGVI